MVGVGFVCCREHPVGGGGEQQGLGVAASRGIGVVEQAVGELCGEVGGVGVEQILEALELVEDDEIGSKSGDADDRHDSPDLADQLAPQGTKLVWEAPLPRQGIHQGVEHLSNPRLVSGCSNAVCFGQLLGEICQRLPHRPAVLLLPLA